MKPLLCVTVTAPSMAELCVARDQVVGADLIELRLDTTHDPSAAAALAGRKGRVIITCRASWEGGHFNGSEEERHRILSEALDLGAEYVDLEWRAGFTDLIAATGGKRIVLSSHDFSGMPTDLPARSRAMRSTGAEVVKIAAKATCLSDCLALLDLASSTQGEGRAVLIAMGDAGLVTRLLPERFGSAWTYAGAVHDVGQLSAEALIKGYHYRSLTGATAVYGLTGSPIGHSVSPAMHNAAFQAAGIDAVYLPLPAADADDFLRFAEAIGLQGSSVTIPFKESLFARVTSVDDTARRSGALNTVKRHAQGWEGRNTDVAGFLSPLAARGMALRGTRLAVLGAGGSARSVALAAASEGAVVTVHARDARRAAAVAALALGQVGEWPPPPGSWDVLVNCTPIGMYPHVDETPLPAAALARAHGAGLVYDLVYNPTETRLLREARAASCDTIGGLDMLVGQAVEQFVWWTGVRPDAAVMRAAATERLAEFKDR